MSESDDKPPPRNVQSVVKFPQSRTRPKTSKPETRDLGLSKLAQQLGSAQANLIGHWCSQCKGIWYGCAGECECPVCGNRNG
jgi:hypothetical protein